MQKKGLISLIEKDQLRLKKNLHKKLNYISKNPSPFLVINLTKKKIKQIRTAPRKLDKNISS